MDTSLEIRPNDDLIRINHQIPRNDNKIKGYGFIFLIIAGVGAIAIGGVGTFSNLSQVNAIVMMAVGYGGGTTCLIMGVVGYKKMRVGVGLNGLIAQARQSGLGFHLEALEFARTTLDRYPEVRASDFDWGIFARSINCNRFGRRGFFGINGTPVNDEISKLTYILVQLYRPRINQIELNESDPWAEEGTCNLVDECIKLEYALICLTCDDMHDLKQRFGRDHWFGKQYSYQYRWIARFTKFYQHVRHISQNQGHIQRFYQENTPQAKWRQLFNSHCDYITQSGFQLGDDRYLAWLRKDQNDSFERVTSTLPT